MATNAPAGDAPAALVAAEAPSKTQVVYPPVVDYLMLADEFKVKRELVTLLLEALGADTTSDVEDVLAIPASMVSDSIANLKKKVDDVETALTPLEAGSVVKYMTRLRSRFTVAAPTQPATSIPPPATGPPETGTKRKICEVLDQLDDRPFEVPDADACRTLRENYKKVCGGKPSESEAPTAEQLGALQAKMDRRSAPYCDFAIFCPNGRRMAKIRRFEAQVFVDNELRQKVLRGPSDFKSWTESWRVFRTAMISLRAAAPQTLDDYFRGIEQLTILFPNAWGLIFCADELMRSEVWDKIREEMEDDRAWPEKLPWDVVIKMSCYGRGDADRQHWWFTHVVAPASSGGGGRGTVAKLEGSSNLPSTDGLYHSEQPRSSGKARGRRAGDASRRGKTFDTGMSSGKGGKIYDGYDYAWDQAKAKGKGGNTSKGGTNGKGNKGGKGKSSDPSK